MPILVPHFGEIHFVRAALAILQAYAMVGFREHLFRDAVGDLQVLVVRTIIGGR